MAQEWWTAKKRYWSDGQLQEKSQSDFDEEWACWQNSQNRKNVGPAPVYREPGSKLLASSWDVIDFGLEHCGTVDKDD